MRVLVTNSGRSNNSLTVIFFGTTQDMLTLRLQNQSQFAVCYFFASVAVFLVSGAMAYSLVQFVEFEPTQGQLTFPRAFFVSSILLVIGSFSLHRALFCVQRERQQPFRRSLLIANLAGAFFVGVQIYGLRCMLLNQIPSDASTGANAFTFVFAALHGLHFIVAVMFLVFVTLRALADRYDHEYYWGVTVCTWFWHTLGIVWIAILAVFAIASASLT